LPVPGYRREWLAADVTAGIVAAAVVIPKAMAFATIAGLPVAVGLYTVLIPPLVYAALGTSRPLSVSTTTTIAILVFADLREVVPSGHPDELATASTTLAVLVGAMLVAASLLRLGFVANFISDPVLAGFKSGIGLVIVVDQLPKLLGIHIEKTAFLRDLWSVVQHVPDASAATLGLSLAMLALMFALERFAPRSPVPLIAIVLGIAASHWLGLGVSTVGDVPRDLPSLVLPHPELVLRLWPGAAGIALMSFTESIAAARAFAHSDEPRPIANRELLALGLANAAGGLFGAMPAGGGTTQTAVNRLAGARTQLAEVVTSATALGALLLLAPMIAQMPNAVLAAVVVVYSVTLIKPAEFRAIARVRSTEFWWSLIAFAGVALLGTLQGIVVAVISSLLSLAHQTWDPPVYVVGRKRGTDVFRPLSSEHPNDETFPGLLMLRLQGRLFFANAQRVADKILALIEQHHPAVVALDCSALIDLEYTGMKMLLDAEPKMHKAGISLWLAALNPDVLEVVKRSPLGESLGREGLVFNLEVAVTQFEKMLRPSP
jgi:high affinity sulfate transporter 1